jgi:hypothetical protein
MAFQAGMKRWRREDSLPILVAIDHPIFRLGHYVQGNRNHVEKASSPTLQEMMMRTTDRSPLSTSTPELIPWLFKLTTHMLARALNMPEPLLHHTGLMVFAQVAAFETSVGGRLLGFFRYRRERSGH